jgi:hypothetical protein
LAPPHRLDLGSASGFLVEDFINAVTSQLDRVQDALRLKAVNRPLTYALKELHLELKVFVEMDGQGQVRLRSPGANETGASVMTLDFTTVTKPMIEENTISMSAARSTPLDALGLAPEETQRLERMGVTTLAQLNRLGAATGVSAVARLAALPVDRLRTVLQQGKPRVTGVGVGTQPPKPKPTPRPKPRPGPVVKPPASSPRPPPPRVVTAPPAPSPRPPVVPVRPPPRVVIPGGGGAAPVVRPPPAQPALPRAGTAVRRATHLALAEDEAAPLEAAALHLPEGTDRLTLHGAHFLAEEGALPRVSLDGHELAIEEADDDRLVLRLPPDMASGVTSGALEIAFGDCEAIALPIAFGPAKDAWPAEPDDDWAPPGEGGVR